PTIDDVLQKTRLEEAILVIPGIRNHCYFCGMSHSFVPLLQLSLSDDSILTSLLFCILPRTLLQTFALSDDCIRKSPKFIVRRGIIR
ncbi:hypothetical protein L9F63_014041, partial [Diploptera punctata]